MKKTVWSQKKEHKEYVEEVTKNDGVNFDF